ncbi:hypothetical protein C7S18_21305 [Ahniella affigens]|uniref:HTH araC/xylS-type domain-containing protein n=1 Tax=Ahniella affigens TaxID=2021234 RepID=A0A2P1PXH4_9GAMM|nr:helix-turn-helix domain-containing protein [Ahniella affigens]AVP99553.1 hypothetical protein C7S18_21305 [Ahniella affigens]
MNQYLIATVLGTLLLCALIVDYRRTGIAATGWLAAWLATRVLVLWLALLESAAPEMGPTAFGLLAPLSTTASGPLLFAFVYAAKLHRTPPTWLFAPIAAHATALLFPGTHQYLDIRVAILPCMVFAFAAACIAFRHWDQNNPLRGQVAAVLGAVACLHVLNAFGVLFPDATRIEWAILALVSSGLFAWTLYRLLMTAPTSGVQAIFRRSQALPITDRFERVDAAMHSKGMWRVPDLNPATSARATELSVSETSHALNRPRVVCRSPATPMPDHFERIDVAMRSRKMWRIPDLSLATLAQATELSVSETSRALNRAEIGGFFAYVNTLRLDDACALLSDPDQARYTVEGLGREAGFATRSTFYKVFRERLGVTPHGFRQKALRKATKEDDLLSDRGVRPSITQQMAP